MTEIKLTLEDPALFAQQLKHAASHWDDGRATPIGQALHMAACQIEEQVKPAIEEPTEGERETNRILHHITGGDFL